ncbi:hypothetical protein HETIRDRAFT_52928, partial [Heterobasidion irregulare TC 32-1]
PLVRDDVKLGLVRNDDKLRSVRDDVKLSIVFPQYLYSMMMMKGVRKDVKLRIVRNDDKLRTVPHDVKLPVVDISRNPTNISAVVLMSISCKRTGRSGEGVRLLLAPRGTLQV